MFLELIATFFAGIAAAGLVMALRYLSKGWLPRWLTPVAAGGAMLFVAISSEYTWYDRTTANLPEGLVVAEITEARQVWRPWTLLAPLANQFTAVDVGTMRTHDARPGTHLADVYVMGRWKPITQFPVLIDCDGSRRALIPSNVVFQPDGTVEGAAWTDVGPEDPVLSAACERRG